MEITLVLWGAIAVVCLVSYIVHRIMLHGSRATHVGADSAARIVSLTESTEATKNLIAAVAFIVGGWWTVHLFHSLQQEADAKARIANTQAETEARVVALRAAILKAKDFPLALSLHTQVTTIQDQRTVIVEAVLKNVGDGPLYFRFPPNAFTLAVLAPTPSGPKIQSIYRSAPVYISDTSVEGQGTRTLLTQQERHVPYVFSLPGPGTYLVQVIADYGDEPVDERASSRQTRANEQAIVAVK